MEFAKQYEHPEWQKRRLKRLELAQFTCEKCKGKEEQLHVHHKRYVKGRKVWEYEDFELEVLCKSCHEESHEDKAILSEVLARFPSDWSMSLASMLAGYGQFLGITGMADSLERCYDAHAQELGSLIGMAEQLNIDQLMELQDIGWEKSLLYPSRSTPDSQG